MSSGEFESAEAFVSHIVSEALHNNGPSEENSESPEDLWDAFSRILGDVPEEELRTLPDDFAAEHDHYIYGAPAKNSRDKHSCLSQPPKAARVY